MGSNVGINIMTDEFKQILRTNELHCAMMNDLSDWGAGCCRKRAIVEADEG